MGAVSVDTRCHEEHLKVWDSTDYRNEFKVAPEYAIEALLDQDRLESWITDKRQQGIVIGWSSHCPSLDAGRRGRLLRVFISWLADEQAWSVDLALEATTTDRRAYRDR